jgi:ABC-type Fe3+-hydroxamate transport system substrate-binding protein
MVLQIGRMTGTLDKAARIVAMTRRNFNSIEPLPPWSVLYLIWRKPYMTVGNDTFIHSMLEIIGLKNLFAHRKRYPVIDDLDALSETCQLVLLPSEPYPFTEKHAKEIQSRLPAAKIVLADGEFFSWYGSKMTGAPAYFNKLFHT